MMATDLLPIGTRVRATFPNASWGEGEIIDADANTKVKNETTGRMIRRKPYVVRRDDDVLGYFHTDQIEEVQS